MFTGKCITEISTHPKGEYFSVMPDINRCQDGIVRPEEKHYFAQLICTTIAYNIYYKITHHKRLI